MDEIKKIEQAAISKGDNEAHLELMRGIVEDIKDGLVTRDADMNGMTNNILALVKILEDELKEEDAAIVYLQKNELTEPIAIADSNRDRVYSGLRYYVRAYSFSLDEAEIESARRLQVLIDNYGKMNSRNYNKQSVALKNFLDDVANYNADDIETIGAENWISLLQETNNKVIKLIEDRFELNVDRTSKMTREVRSNVDTIYYRIAAMLEAGYMISKAASYANVIDKVNERIHYFKTTLAIHQGHLDAKKDEGEEFE